jgi:RimK-like ATP-grasp domain
VRPGVVVTAGTIRNARRVRLGTPLILLWGAPEEQPLAAVRSALHGYGAETVMVDQRHALSTRVLLPSGGQVLKLSGGDYPLAWVTAAYPRPYPFLPEIPDGSPAALVARRHIIRLEQQLWQWMATTPATVVNRPAPAASNSTKPFQVRTARTCGFHVPDSLLTNDVEKARAFAARHGPVVYKGLGGTRTLTGLLDLADTRRLGRLSTCPTYLQRYIQGTNVRAHVVGTEVFASEITTDAVDYRKHVQEMVPVSLPGSVADKCRALTKALELLLTGIDLIRSRDGEWYFLEANPSPAFTFYPGHDKVAAAIARLLIGQPTRG